MSLSYRRVRLPAESCGGESRPPREISIWKAHESRRRRPDAHEHRRQGSENIDRAAAVTVLSPFSRLLAHIVDYAGTFPPASLAVADAVSAYACERCGPDAWLLGRLVLPAQSLDAVENATWSPSTGEWHLSAIAGSDARAALARVNAFNARWAG